MTVTINSHQDSTMTTTGTTILKIRTQGDPRTTDPTTGLHISKIRTVTKRKTERTIITTTDVMELPTTKCTRNHSMLTMTGLNPENDPSSRRETKKKCTRTKVDLNTTITSTTNDNATEMDRPLESDFSFGLFAL